MSILIPGQIRKANMIGLALGILASVLIYFLSLMTPAHAGTIIVCNHLGCHRTHAAVHKHHRYRHVRRHARRHHRIAHRHRARRPRIAHGIIICNRLGCSDRAAPAAATRSFSARRAYDANGNVGEVIGGRPRGCPHAYCGCGLARYLGLRDKSLNVADNWRRKYPRTHAHPGAVAVRAYHRHGHGHVMLLVRHIAGSNWIVREYNGYRHLSYVHERSVRGFTFVNPGGSRMASIF